jgi:hypothetical protein
LDIGRLSLPIALYTKGESMKTPDDFAQVISQRKTDNNWKTKRGKPPSIIITLVLAVLFLAMGALGVLKLGTMMEQVLQGQGLFVPWMGYFALQLGMTGLALVTIFACLKRPRWGRAVSIVFAVSFGIRFALGLAFPNPHPVFAIAPGVEQAGAYAAQVMMAFGTVIYLWSMTVGAKVQAYFAEI